MCFAALIPLAIGVAGGLLQGQQAQAQAASQASALDRNAQFLSNAAADARKRGAYEADWQRVQTQSLIGSQRAAQAANGGLVDQDTNAIITQDTAQLGELDALTIANNAAREAYGYEVEASDARLTASNLRKQGKRAMTSSLLGGALSGASSAFGGGMFGGASSGLGAGTTAALSSTSRLNNNQAYA